MSATGNPVTGPFSLFTKFMRDHVLLDVDHGLAARLNLLFGAPRSVLPIRFAINVAQCGDAETAFQSLCAAGAGGPNEVS